MATTSISKTILHKQYEGDGFYLAQFKTAQLSIYSYYLESNKEAIIIDPTFDVHPYQNLEKKRQSKIIAVYLTHYHADFISGHGELNLPIVMGQGSLCNDSTLKVSQYKHGYKVNLGQVWIKFLHTPGHTLESTCFYLFDKNQKEYGLFTGDTIFLGEVGRPDLAVSQITSQEDLARLLFSSIQMLKKQISPDCKLFPGHGSGSSCGKNIGQGDVCTMGKQLENNYALKIENEEQFVKIILEGMPKPPSYFFNSAKLNSKGCTKFQQLLKKSLHQLTLQQVHKEIQNGTMVIDSRTDLKGGCIKGAYLMSDGGKVATFVGNMFHHDVDIVLICPEGKQSDFIERLLRIGYFNIKGYGKFNIEDWKAKGYQWYESKSTTIKQLKQIKDYHILDVRNPGEWKNTGVVEKAITISLPQLEKRVQQLKNVDNIYINCLSGWRAKVAFSILAKNGIKSTFIADKFQSYKECGFNVIPV